MHINYMEQGQSIDEACDTAVRWGFDGIEFRRAITAYSDPESYLDKIASAVQRAGLKKVSFGMPGPQLMGDDQKKRENEVSDYLHFLKLAVERFQLSVLNTSVGHLLSSDPSVNPADFEQQGSWIAEERHWEQAVEGFRRIAIACEQLKVWLAFETHPGFLHDLPSTARRLLDLIASPYIGVNLDYANVVYFSNPPSLEDSLNLFPEDLFMVHLKNSMSYGSCRKTVGLSEGEINNRAFLRGLKQRGFAGPICLESPRSGDREGFLLSDSRYLGSILEEMAW